MIQQENLTTLVPENQRSTYILLNSSFPGRVPEPFYLPLLFVLYEEMSHQSISTVVPFVTDKEWSEVYNDIPIVGGYKQGREQLSEEFLERVAEVRRILDEHGWQEWLQEE